jgi:hypothetical protein
VAAVTAQGKLRNRQNRTAYILHRQVHLACLILKNAHTAHLVNNIGQILIGIALGHTQKHQKALLYLAGNLFIYSNTGAVYTLHNCSHFFLPPLPFAVEIRRSTE